MRILGIDPGYSILGWAVIEHDLKVVDFGIIESGSEIEMDEKLLLVFSSLTEIIKKYNPECAAIERLFFHKNTKTAIDVAKCMGVVILALKQAGLRFIEYSPSRVKQSITGYGRATKEQMQHMMMKIFKIESIPEPDDAADALAIATCHSLCMNNLVCK